jgi:hypothetical protein
VPRPQTRLCLALGVLCALTACAKTEPAPPHAVPETATAGARVGYVRMDEVIKHHPLYGQLAQYEENIEAFDLRASVPHALGTGQNVAKQEAQLEAELRAAATRTNTLLAQKQRQYQARESQAIATALRSAGVGGATIASIQAQIRGDAGRQNAAVAAAAERDFANYQKNLSARDHDQLVAAQKALTDRASRTYMAKQDELQAQEAALSLSLVKADAAARLDLRTKLESLALSDDDRADTQKQLTALDRKEADAIAAMKNRDTQTLALLAQQLRGQVQRDLQTRIAAIRALAIAKLGTRRDDVRKQFGGPASPVFVGGATAATSVPNVSPQLRAKLQALHADFEKHFVSDARATLADFKRTREDLQQRFDALGGIDAGSARGAQAEIVLLQKKRAQLYDQMVAQIGREARLIAQERGIGIVVTDPIATPGGIDLTDDTARDIETLHE